ncbi:RNA ligase family protein [Rhizobium ruizarguesonis]|uniref:RNA ligase family protein n=1 Tax=Rhizobium ruizarguesonis TaxID=2081791 RepID=UPI001031958B|nr:RNA ligase family protein [Rhizobium ruizarguesonis]TBE87817.1 hypothetical protein ELG99_13730 [Rhizobium ruizarguesonis]
MTKPVKPLGIKGYGSTPHLTGSRVGPEDYSLSPEQSRLFTLGPARRGDRFIVTEKVDGSCVAVARVGDEIHALNRAGYPAWSSPYALHLAFDRWVQLRKDRFLDLLMDDERVVGEWVHTATGTRYHIVDPNDLFVSFSIMRMHDRIPYDDFAKRIDEAAFLRAHVLHDGGPLPIDTMLTLLGESGFHGALDGAEGAVWLHENESKFSAIAKYVKQTKTDGRYLSRNTGGDDVLNYHGVAF